MARNLYSMESLERFLQAGCRPDRTRNRRGESPTLQGVSGMNKPGERFLIYTALLILCALISALAGPAAGICSFLQVTATIEIIGWMGADSEEHSASGPLD